MWELKRLKVWPMSRIYAVLMAIMGFILGIFYFILGRVSSSLGISSQETELFIKFGAAAIIILPIIYGLLGLVLGALSAFLYNLVARWVGGIEIQFDNKKRGNK